MTYLVINRSDGGVTVYSLGPKDTPEKCIAAWEDSFKENGVQIATCLDYKESDTDPALADRFFRNSWEADNTQSSKLIRVSIPRAKVMAHDIRRKLRSQEFKPIDGDSMSVVVTPEAEIHRQTLRDKYASMQMTIDSAKTPSAIKGALGF